MATLHTGFFDNLRLLAAPVQLSERRVKAKLEASQNPGSPGTPSH